MRVVLIALIVIVLLVTVAWINNKAFKTGRSLRQKLDERR